MRSIHRGRQRLGNSVVNVLMDITTSNGTSAGTYPITVTGTSGLLSHSASVSLIVAGGSVSSSDFTLAVTEAFPSSVPAGTSQTAKVSLTANYSGSVKANCDASPIPGTQCAITPQSPVTISANQTVMLTLVLNLPLTIIQDCSVSSATPTQTVTAGQTTGAYQLTVAPNPPGSSFSDTVSLSCTAGLPAGAQCMFSPSTVTPGNSAANVVMNISTTKANSARTQRLASGQFLPAAIWLPLVARWPV